MNQPPRVLPMVGAVLLVLVGLGPRSGALGGSGGGTGIFGFLMLGLGVLSALRQGLPATAHKDTSQVSSATLTAPQGPELGLLLVSARRDLLVGCASLVLVAACAAAGAVSAFAAGAAGLGVVLIVAAAATAATLIGPGKAHWRATTLELTPTNLITTHHGSRCVVPWTDISGAVPANRPTTPGALVVNVTANLPRTRGWLGWPKPSKAPGGVLALMVQDLGVHPKPLARVISLCATNAALRAELGDPVSTYGSAWPPMQTAPGPDVR